MSWFLKKRWPILLVSLLIFTKGFSQDCSVEYFSKSYTGVSLFGMSGSQGDRLTILPDSSMVMCNSRFLARVSQNGNVLWSKFIFGSGNTGTANALVDYDSSIVCVMGSTIIKFDTLGNVLYQKTIHLGIGTNNDTTNTESFRDIAILDNGDKVLLYQDDLGSYGGYLVRFDKDMNMVRWCKMIQSVNTQQDNIGFTNLLIEGDKIVVAGCRRQIAGSTRSGFLASFDTSNGSLARINYFNCINMGGFDRLYKGNGQYFVTGYLLNQSDAAGRYCYIRIDAGFNVLAIRRIVGYTDNFPTTFSYAPQSDNSLYGMVGRGGFTSTMFYIDNTDSVRWARAYSIESYPSDVKQNSEALFFAGDHNYNAVGVGPKSTFTIHKSDFNGKVGNCVPTSAATFKTNNYNFTAGAPPALQLAAKVCSILTDNNSFGNYSINASGCKYSSICDSIKLIGDTAICNAQAGLYTGRRNVTCKNPISWSINPATNYTIVNDNTISINFTANGNYKIISKINDRCNEYNDSINVYVNLSGLIDMPADSTLCAGNTIKLSAGNQFKTYEWQDGSTDSIFIVNQPGKYFITVTDYCGNTYSDTININAANFYFSIGNDTAKCNGDTLILKATSGFHNYQWSPAYSLTIVNDTIVRVNPLLDTMYIATAEKMPGCFVKDTVHISVLQSPPVFLGNDTSLCSGQSLLLDAGNNFSSYEWSTGHGTQSITANSTGVYSVKAIASNGCSSTDTLQVLSVITLPFFTLGIDTTLCEGQKLAYNFNLPGVAYLWSSGNTLNSETIESSGLSWLKITEQSCYAADSIHVFYKPSPVVNLGKDTILCDDVTEVLNAFNNNATYQWQDGTTMSSYLVAKAGLYYVTADINGCKAKDSVYINYKSKPEVSLVADTFICKGQEILLSPASATSNNYLWQDGSTNIPLAVRDTGIYKLTTNNECGITTNSVKVDWGTCELYMPSAFTPNNNGVNDVFRVKYIFVASRFIFTVYNRFGEPVFESNNINAGWDGTYKGVAQNAGAYVWTISFTDSKNARRFAKGTVLLIR